MTFNTDAHLRRIRDNRRKHQKQALNATCPNCKTDLLDQLTDAGYTDIMASTAMISCPHCQAEITFSLEWRVEIYKATIQETRLPVPA